MKRVIIESPYAPSADHTIEDHLRYLRACMADSIHRGEAPYASHALYTQPGVLRDGVPEERALGIDAGFAWRQCAEMSVFYADLGWSKGMLLGRADCEAKGTPFEVRTLLQWEQGNAAATTTWGTAIAQGSIAPIHAKDVRPPIGDETMQTIEGGEVGRAIAVAQDIHLPDVVSLEPKVVVGQRTLDHAVKVATGLVAQIENLPLTQQAGDTIAVCLAVLHYATIG